MFSKLNLSTYIHIRDRRYSNALNILSLFLYHTSWWVAECLHVAIKSNIGLISIIYRERIKLKSYQKWNQNINFESVQATNKGWILNLNDEFVIYLCNQTKQVKRHVVDLVCCRTFDRTDYKSPLYEWKDSSVAFPIWNVPTQRNNDPKLKGELWWLTLNQAFPQAAILLRAPNEQSTKWDRSEAHKI